MNVDENENFNKDINEPFIKYTDYIHEGGKICVASKGVKFIFSNKSNINDYNDE